ncbi:hypothetical protein EON65_58710 [archaeon]|nr:MAG: hypothetical protein EON65_58710 [archaeon]
MFRGLIRPASTFLLRPAQRSYQKFPLQAEMSKDAPPTTGYNYVLNRVANIALNLAEKQPAKTLHIFPENNFVTYLGKVCNWVIHTPFQTRIHHTINAPQCTLAHHN